MAAARGREQTMAEALAQAKPTEAMRERRMKEGRGFADADGGDSAAQGARASHQSFTVYTQAYYSCEFERTLSGISTRNIGDIVFRIETGHSKRGHRYTGSVLNTDTGE